MRHNYDTKRLLVFWVDLGVFKALALGVIPVCPLEETDPEGAARRPLRMSVNHISDLFKPPG